MLKIFKQNTKNKSYKSFWRKVTQNLLSDSVGRVINSTTTIYIRQKRFNL